MNVIRHMRMRRRWLMTSKYAVNILCAFGGFTLGLLFLTNTSMTNTFAQLKFISNAFITNDQQQANNNATSYSDDSMDSKIKEFQQIERSMSATLYRDIRLICWIMHSPDRTAARQAIIETWGRRCNHLLFVIGNKSAPTDEPNVVQLAPNVSLLTFNMDDKYDLLWLKTKLAFKYITRKYKNQYDWIYKLDDDTYVVVENLKLFLRSKNPDDKFYYGCQYASGYNSGGPGYVMSRSVAETFVSMLNTSGCHQGDTGAEDGHVGSCLSLAKVSTGDTRDSKERFRFSPFIPEQVIDKSLLPSRYNWFYGFSSHKMKDGLECCSDSAIAYHYISPSFMRTMEYLTYYLHPFSIRDEK